MSYADASLLPSPGAEHEAAGAGGAARGSLYVCCCCCCCCCGAVWDVHRRGIVAEEEFIAAITSMIYTSF